jgi:hypothetical protein
MAVACTGQPGIGRTPTRQMDTKIRTKISLSDSDVPDVLEPMLWVHSGRRC